MVDRHCVVIRDILEDRVPLYGPQVGWATVATIDAAYRAGNDDLLNEAQVESADRVQPVDQVVWISVGR